MKSASAAAVPAASSPLVAAFVVALVGLGLGLGLGSGLGLALGLGLAHPNPNPNPDQVQMALLLGRDGEPELRALAPSPTHADTAAVMRHARCLL